MSIGSTQGLAQLSALLAIPLILVLLVYFSGKALRLLSYQSSKNRRQHDGTEELLQLLVIGELLSKRHHEPAHTNTSTSGEGKEA